MSFGISVNPKFEQSKVVFEVSIVHDADDVAKMRKITSEINKGGISHLSYDNFSE